MTPCTKPVTRLTGTQVRDGSKRRALVVTLHNEFIEIRPHGTRRQETVLLDEAYHAAVKARVFRERADKAKARKAKKGATSR